jgi:hypothetical protein
MAPAFASAVLVADSADAFASPAASSACFALPIASSSRFFARSASSAALRSSASALS